MTWVNAMNLGDCWWHTLFLKKLGGEHVFHCREDHHDWIKQLVGNDPIEIKGMTDIPPDAQDCWIGAQHPNSWHANRCPDDIIGYLVNWFRGWGSSSFDRNSLLAPYLGSPEYHRPGKILLIDSDPRSGQCPEYNADEMSELKRDLGGACIAIKDSGMTLSEISETANTVKAIAGVATGPMWPCLQQSTISTPKYLILEPIRVRFDGCEIKHSPNVRHLREQLTKDGWL